MDQHYSYCEKHDAQWHTMTNGEECPFCKIEMANGIKPLLCDGWRKYPDEDPKECLPAHGLFFVIICWDDKPGSKMFAICSYMEGWIGEKWMYKGNVLRNGKVTAYMPLVSPAFA